MALPRTRPSLSAPVLPFCCFAVAWGIAAARAQDGPPGQPPAPVEIERPLLQSAADDLAEHAELCFKNGFPRRARVTWLEVLAEYDPDHAQTRERLGYVQVGTAWQPRTDFEFPQEDTLSASAARMLETRWEALARKLGKAHLELAGRLAEAGHEERARHHRERAMRFTPEDAAVKAAMGVRNFEGVDGTELELQLLQRSRLMDRAVTRLTDASFEVRSSERKDRHLDAAGVGYSAVESEHFVVYGDWPAEVLMDAARWAERALQFCHEAFAGYERWPPKRPLMNAFAFLKEREDWVAVVRKNHVRNADFVVRYTSSCAIGSGEQGIQAAGFDNQATIFDYAVRRVVQQYSLLGTDALNEGIGHAVVGMMFGRNLIFSVAQEEEKGTVTGRDRKRFQMPDLEIWKDLARELAFDKATAPAARLPLLSAARFSSEERIKAWSFCDYLLRRDPLLLLALDAAGGGRARNEIEVAAGFAERTKGLQLAEVEADWRRFYVDDTPALRAIRNKVTPLEAVSKEAPRWLDEFNRLRRESGASAVGWSASHSTDCRMHVDYLEQNKDQRGPAAEHTQVPGKPGFTNVGRQFAATALVWTGDRDPRKAMKDWLLLPGYRDALLNRNLDQVGIYASGRIMAMDVQRGRAATGRAESAFFPYANAAGNRYKDTLPAAVDVELLGPEVRALLDQRGRGRSKEVGFPITAHFYGANSGDVRCLVTAAGEAVEGVLVRGDGEIRRTSAPGLWTFYPLDPLRKGVDIKVQWLHGGGTNEVTFAVS